MGLQDFSLRVGGEREGACRGFRRSIHLKLHYLSRRARGSLICSYSSLTLTWSLWSPAGISRAHHLSRGILLALHSPHFFPARPCGVSALPPLTCRTAEGRPRRSLAFAFLYIRFYYTQNTACWPFWLPSPIQHFVTFKWIWMTTIIIIRCYAVFFFGDRTCTSYPK